MELKPLITEKATRLAGHRAPVYSFIIGPKVNKPEVIKAVKKQYQVTPTKVAIINLPRKKVQRRGQKPGYKGGLRKALVYLSAGETITVA